MARYQGCDLDDQLIEVLNGLTAALGEVPPLGKRTVEQARKMLVERARYYGSLGAIRDDSIKVVNQTIAGSGGEIPIRIYMPPGLESNNNPLLIYFHGGAWMRGNLDTHDALARQLASASGCYLISVNYRLAPEHPFPAALEDAYAALAWAEDTAPPLQIDPFRIGVVGDSSGANLAAAVALKARDEGKIHLTCQFLLNPVLDLSAFNTQSYQQYGSKGFGLTREKMEWARDLYLGGKDLAGHPYVSPLLAKDFSGLPPAMIVTSAYDPLRDEGEKYADLLSTAGVQTKYLCVPKVNHGIFDLVGVIDAANDALKDVAHFIRAI